MKYCNGRVKSHCTYLLVHAREEGRIMGKTRRKNLVKNREKEEEEESTLPYIPKHIVTNNILERVPSIYLHETFRHVCKSWNDIISSPEFAAKNVIHAKSELLLQVSVSLRHTLRYRLKSLEMDQRLLDFKINSDYPRMGMIRSSCYGLVLVEGNDNQRQGGLVLQVKNLYTKCCLTLPKCPSDCKHVACGAALGFDPSTKEYKVVHTYADDYGYEIFTLGCSDNAWRKVPGPFKEPYERPSNVQSFRWRDPVLVNGRVMHWYVDSKEYVVSMNISDEQPYKTYFPEFDEEIQKHRYRFIEMGGNLSFWYQVSGTQIDVWILKDIHGRNWVKIHSMMAESINYCPNSKCSSTSNIFNPLPDFMKLLPVAALRDGEVIVFKHMSDNYKSDHLYFYDIQQMVLKKFRFKITADSRFIPHRSSLIHWEDEKELLPNR
ncbi:hypothetical protein ACOSQ3_029859 [Xanthoceras sorbifolium]